MQTMKKMSMAAASLTTLVSSASGRVAAFWSKSCTVPHMFNSLGPCIWMNNSISVAAHLVAILAVLVARLPWHHVVKVHICPNGHPGISMRP